MQNPSNNSNDGGSFEPHPIFSYRRRLLVRNRSANLQPKAHIRRLATPFARLGPWQPVVRVIVTTTPFVCQAAVSTLIKTSASGADALQAQGQGQDLGLGDRQTHEPPQGNGRSDAQAGGDHACDVGRRHLLLRRSGCSQSGCERTCRSQATQAARSLCMTKTRADDRSMIR
jgi:hypothetical protein